MVNASDGLRSRLWRSHIAHLQKKYQVSSNTLLAKTAGWMALFILTFGPGLDQLVSKENVFRYVFKLHSFLFLLLSCFCAILVNISQYACLGTYSAVSFQIIGHLKTILIYVLGAILFHSKITFKGVFGFGLALCGIVCYNISSHNRKKSSATSTEATQELPVQSTFQQRALGLGFAFALNSQGLSQLL